MTLRHFFTKRRTGLLVAAALVAGWLLSGISPLGAAPGAAPGAVPGAVPGVASGAAGPVPAAGAASAASARALPVVTAPVESVDGYSMRHTYSGQLRPRREAELGWESSGRVARVLVDRGDRVEAGAVLAELERERSSAEVAGLRAAQEREAARLEELVQGPRKQTLAAARADVQRLKDELKLAELLFARRTELRDHNASSQEEVDLSSTRVSTLRAQLASSESLLDQLEEGTRSENLAQQRAAVAELDARLERAEVELRDRVLRAPFDGVVTERFLDEGAVVSAGVTAVRMIENLALEAHIGVPIERALELNEGDAIALEIRGEPVTSVLRSIVPELDAATRTADLVIALAPGASERHFAGEAVQLVLEDRVDIDGVWVPTSALVPGARGLWAAFVVVDERIERRELEVLYTTGDQTLVRGNIEAGESLVAQGVHRVVPGQRVVPGPLEQAR